MALLQQPLPCCPGPRRTHLSAQPPAWILHNGALLTAPPGCRAPAPCGPPAPEGLTLGRQEVDQDNQGGDQHAGDDDVDDVEEGLALDDEEVVDLRVAGRLRAGHQGQALAGWAVPDGPLAILCRGRLGLS